MLLNQGTPIRNLDESKNNNGDINLGNMRNVSFKAGKRIQILLIFAQEIQLCKPTFPACNYCA